MTSADGPIEAPRTSGPGRVDAGGLDPEALRPLLDALRTRLTLALDGWEAEVTGAPAGARPAPTYSRPAAVPPVRMEQLHRTPEPTADLDDLVDVLAPRLLERLVPALREALREER